MSEEKLESQLLVKSANRVAEFETKSGRRASAVRALITTLLLLALAASGSLFTVYAERRQLFQDDPHQFALKFLDKHPLFDSHIDLAEWVRHEYRNNASAIDLSQELLPTSRWRPSQVDIPRLRKGRVGGFVWSVHTKCPSNSNATDRWTLPTNSVRDTLEQIDVAKALIAKYPKVFAPAASAGEIRSVMARGKIASVLGIEGGHQFGNSLAAVRQFYDMGVRYATLTHSCHNAFADSAGVVSVPPPFHGGLSPFGVVLVHEMNRIGMIVDISHVSEATAVDVLTATKAPVIWSHSNAMGVWKHPRNVPDYILEMIGTGHGKVDAVVQVNFAPQFVAPEGEVTLQKVADHVEWIASITGRAHVGVGSDFDGITGAPEDLEDASKYPNLIAELHRRGWSEKELRGFVGGNFLRVMESVEAVARELKDEPRAEDLYYLRDDI